MWIKISGKDKKNFGKGVPANPMLNVPERTEKHVDTRGGTKKDPRNWGIKRATRVRSEKRESQRKKMDLIKV